MKSVKETILEVLNHKYFNGVKSLETIENRKLLAKIEFEKNSETDIFDYEENSLFEYLTNLETEITFLRHLNNLKKCKMSIDTDTYKDENRIIKFEIEVIF